MHALFTLIVSGGYFFLAYVLILKGNIYISSNTVQGFNPAIAFPLAIASVLLALGMVWMYCETLSAKRMSSESPDTQLDWPVLDMGDTPNA